MIEQPSKYHTEIYDRLAIKILNVVRLSIDGYVCTFAHATRPTISPDFAKSAKLQQLDRSSILDD